MTTTDLFIDQLADTAKPVRPVRERHGRVAGLLAAAGTVAFVLGYYGVRPQLATGTVDAVTLVLIALFGLLAVAAGITAVRMAQPAVGSPPSGAPWLLGAVMIFPAIAVVEALIGHGESSQAFLGTTCLKLGSIASLLTAAVLVLHLRRGAPVLPEQAGLYAGVSAGAVGAMAFTLECGGSTFAHLSFWHVGIVAIWAVIGRTILPRLVRW